MHTRLQAAKFELDLTWLTFPPDDGLFASTEKLTSG
jgi:hypothetical protein